MDKIKTVKIKNEDGSISEETYTISVDALNVDMANNKNLQETIGTINIDTDGNIAYQLDNLKNNKVNKVDVIDNLNSAESDKVLSANQGKVLKDTITILNEDVKKKAYYFDTVVDMKNANLEIGDYVCTLGYYEENDGGGAEYVIRSTISTDIDDDAFTINLSNGLIGALIIKNDTVNIKSIGAKSQQYSVKKGESFYDNKIIIDKTINYLNAVNGTGFKGSLTLFFPAGFYGFSETHIYRRAGLKFKGEPNFPRIEPQYSEKKYTTGVVITPLNDNQNYIWKIGGAPLIEDTSYESERRFMVDSDIDGLTFTTINYSGTYVWARYGLLLDGVLYSHFGKLYFYHFRGCPIGIRSCWEDYFEILNFRGIADVTSPCLHFLPVSYIIDAANNVSGCYFNYMMFENCGGDLILFDYHSEYVHNEIGTINIEDGFTSMPGQTAFSYTYNDDVSEMHHCAVFKGAACKSTINTINYNETRRDSWPGIIVDATGEKYIRDCIFYCSSEELTQYIVNTLNISTWNKETDVLYAPAGINFNGGSLISISQINFCLLNSASYPTRNIWFNVNNFPNISIGKISKNGIGGNIPNKALPFGYIDLTDKLYISNAYHGGRLYGSHNSVPFSLTNTYAMKKDDDNHCIALFRWPYAYNSNKKYQITFYIKGEENASIGIQLGSSNNNATTYCSASTTATGQWQAIEKIMTAKEALTLNSAVYVNSKGYSAKTVGIVGISIIEMDNVE